MARSERQQAKNQPLESGFNLNSAAGYPREKQAHKRDSVGLVVHGKLDKKRAGPEKEGRMLWIVKGGKPPRQERIV